MDRGEAEVLVEGEELWQEWRGRRAASGQHQVAEGATRFMGGRRESWAKK